MPSSNRAGRGRINLLIMGPDHEDQPPLWHPGLRSGYFLELWLFCPTPVPVVYGRAMSRLKPSGHLRSAASADTYREETIDG